MRASSSAPSTVRTYASAATIRRRVYARYAYGPDAIDALARQVAAIRVTAYEARLAELARTTGRGGLPKLTDPEVLRRIARESRDVAAGIVRTHNEHLRQWVRKQPSRTAEGAPRTQRDLAEAARAHLADRAQGKARDIARTEGMAGRNAALRDVLTINQARVRVRAEPRDAAEPICAAIVANGWYEVRDAPELPAHPNCRHSWAASDRIAAVAAARERFWLGEWSDG